MASSSSGNSYLVKAEGTAVLVDVGISTKRIEQNLFVKGVELSEIDAVLITHEHIDHVKGLKSVLKKAKQAKVFMSPGTLEGIRCKYPDIYETLLILNQSDRVETIEGGDEFCVGELKVKAFNVSHDTFEPLGYTFYAEEKRASIVTDTGCITEEIFQTVKESDLLILEANHEPNILLYGSYPFKLKQRILSDRGHLSNEACAECLIKILESTGAVHNPVVFLAHLSQENNTPEQALITVRNALEENGFIDGKDIFLQTLKKDEASELIRI